MGENTIGQEEDCIVGRNGAKKCAPPPQDIAIEEKIIHPQYKKRLPYDIGLLRLSSPVSMNNRAFVNTICLPTTEQLQKQQVEDRFLIAGWGKTESSPAMSKNLLKASVSRQSVDSCRMAFRAEFIPDDLLICAGGENQVDTCVGDSGGPLFWKAKIHSGSRYIQYGLTGNGYYDCGQLLRGKTPPSMYTNIAAHIDWIKSEMY